MMYYCSVSSMLFLFPPDPPSSCSLPPPPSLQVRQFDPARLSRPAALGRRFSVQPSDPEPGSSTVQARRGGSWRAAEERPRAEGGGGKEMGMCVKINGSRASSLHLTMDMILYSQFRMQYSIQ